MRRVSVALVLAVGIALGSGLLPVRVAETASPVVVASTPASSPALAQPATIPAGMVQVISGCVIRWNSSGPYIYENDGHICTGATSVSVNSAGSLVVKQIPGHIKVASFGAFVDERTGKIISAGTSGGVVETLVKFHDRDGNVVRADSSLLRSNSYNNIQLYWDNLDEAA